MEVDDLDGRPVRYEYWTYFKGSITYGFRDGGFLSATSESYPAGGVLPAPYRPEYFTFGESPSVVLTRLSLQDVGSAPVDDELLPGVDLIAGDRLLLGFLDQRLIYVQTLAMTAGSD